MATRESRAPAHLSLDEFLAAYDGVHAEWVRGEVAVVSPGSERHSDLAGWLAALLRLWADAHDVGRVFVPAYSLRLGDSVVREPDVFFVRRENANRIHGTFVDGPADLVIEITSPSTRGTDRGEKFREYEAAGVSDYWMIDPLREQAEAFRLDADGRFAVVDPGEPLTGGALPGMEIPRAWLWRRPLPKITWVLKEWEIL